MNTSTTTPRHVFKVNLEPSNVTKLQGFILSLQSTRTGIFSKDCGFLGLSSAAVPESMFTCLSIVLESVDRKSRGLSGHWSSNPWDTLKKSILKIPHPLFTCHSLAVTVTNNLYWEQWLVSHSLILTNNLQGTSAYFITADETKYTWRLPIDWKH